MYLSQLPMMLTRNKCPKNIHIMYFFAFLLPPSPFAVEYQMGKA